MRVDAFTRRAFHGNAAAVVLVGEANIDDATMLAIADENNLSETAFVRWRGGAAGGVSKGREGFGVRWFTPAREVDLCGHATLAAAHVLWSRGLAKGSTIVFQTRSGELVAERSGGGGGDGGGLIVLDLPAMPGRQVPVDPGLALALGAAPSECYRSDTGTLMAVYENRREVYGLTPDMVRVAGLDCFGVIVTAPGSGHDFVSRFFAPKAGVPEDPVTGLAHCTLVPYWSDRLGKKRLTARQVSKRGGELACEDVGTRVRLGGHAVTTMEGTTLVPRGTEARTL